jgi:hypothetical protein
VETIYFILSQITNSNLKHHKKTAAENGRKSKNEECTITQQKILAAHLYRLSILSHPQLYNG